MTLQLYHAADRNVLSRIPMKAITYSRYGSPDVLEIEDVDSPVPKDDEVLVNVRAAEASKADCELRSFKFGVKWFWLPLRLGVGVVKPRKRVLGNYFSGVVAAVGGKVTRLAIGDEVFGSAGFRRGAYAEYLSVPEHYPVIGKPANMTFEEAAAVPLGGLNAIHFTRLAEIEPGQRVLVNGAGGSIGAHIVQIAKAFGAEVTAVDGPYKEAMVRRVGADHFVDYTQERFAGRGEKYHAILDMVPGSSYGDCIASLVANGRYLKVNPRLSDLLHSVWTTKRTDKTVRVAFARETREELAALRTMIEEGKIVSIVDTVYPMSGAGEAHRRVDAEERAGAIVIAMKA
jgi:NADPH:quinone reductase-like Zn-dependent oxidoreductase